MLNPPPPSLTDRIAAARAAISALDPLRGSHLHEADLALMGAADCRTRGASGVRDLEDAARAIRRAWEAREVDDLAADRLFRLTAALVLDADREAAPAHAADAGVLASWPARARRAS